jgi:hypothetical protein
MTRAADGAPSDPELEEQLVEAMVGFRHDPLGYVLYAFPWGEGELGPTPENPNPGPDEWQVKLLKKLGERLRDGRIKSAQGVWRFVGKAIRMARSSGHGIGKSAMVAWLVKWSLDTMEDTRGIVTANTDTQLMTKTWPEIGKWHRLAITSHWFHFTATALYSADPAHEKTWRFDAIPWNITKPEAFAGLHNAGKRIVVIFDEASAIADAISEVTEGALTDKETEIIWLKFGNPTRNTGHFHACFNADRDIWEHDQIDSRTCRMTNKDQIQEWLERYGENSDFFRVRVRGVFPKLGDRQFIGADIIEAARGRHVNEAAYSFAPKILTLDNAWDGGDEIVMGIRQGLAYRQLAVLAKNDNDLVIAQALARFEDEEKADAVFIDKGYGTGVYSIGKGWNRVWTLVPFGGEAEDANQFVNKRAEMWSRARDWLRAGGCIPDDEQLCTELAAPEIVGREDGKVQLEKKSDIKKRVGFSPGRADALALSFAFNVQTKLRAGRGAGARAEFSRPHGYDPEL